MEPCSNDNDNGLPIEHYDLAVEEDPDFDINEDSDQPIENMGNDEHDEPDGMEDIDEDNYRLLRHIINRPDRHYGEPLDGRVSNCSSTSSTLTDSPQPVAGCSRDYEPEDSNTTIRRILREQLNSNGLRSTNGDDTDDECVGQVVCFCLSPKTDFSDNEDNEGNGEQNNENNDNIQNQSLDDGESAPKKRHLDNEESEDSLKRICVAEPPTTAVEGGLIDIFCASGPSEAVHVDISCVTGPYRDMEESDIDIRRPRITQARRENDIELFRVITSVFGIQPGKQNPPLDISSFVLTTSQCFQYATRNPAYVDMSCVAGPSHANDAVIVETKDPPFEISIYIGSSSDNEDFDMDPDDISIIDARLRNAPASIPNWLRRFLNMPRDVKNDALRKLLSYCSTAHLSQIVLTIQPVYERDFISLLPKEIALILLSYLEPNDLMRASQTCWNWRVLSNDNLLWKEMCRRIGIYERARTPSYLITNSPWKSTYMKQFLIDKNWIRKPINGPVVMMGHENHVITCLEFRESFVLTGSDDCTLKVWSACSGRMLHDLVGHTGGVWAAQMVGNTIVSGSTDHTLRIWDMKSGKCRHVLKGHSSTVRCLQIHRDKVVSGSRDSTLRIWSLEDGACIQTLEGHSSAVRCVQYNGKYVISGGYDWYVKVWNPLTGTCIHTLTGHTNRIYTLLFDGVHVVSGSLDTSIKVWDVVTGSLMHTLVGHQSLTSGMELKNNILISGNADTTIKLWNIKSGLCIRTLGGPYQHSSAVTGLQTTHRFIISCSDDGTVKLWDLRTGQFLRNVVQLETGGAGGVVWRICATPTRLVCAVGSRNLIEDTKVLSLNFNIPGTCSYCNE